MPLQKIVKDKSIYSVLFDFCQEHNFWIDRNRLYHALGKIVFSQGEIYTLEELNVPIQKYKLIPLALSKKDVVPNNLTPNDLTILTPEEIASISKLKGNEVEYIALNTHIFPILGNDYWENWNALDQHDGHQEIYKKILTTINHCIRKKSKIVVLGCGTGEFLDVLTEQGYQAIGIDSNNTNVHLALSQGRTVIQKRIDEITFDHPVDLVLDPGVLSAAVVERAYVAQVLPKISAMIKPDGYFIHAPFSRSLFSSEDLSRSGFIVCNMTIPQNLFGYERPQQFYVAQKTNVPHTYNL